MSEYRAASGSVAEDLFIDLFSDTFGAEKAGYLYSQYPFFDIYQNTRFADFVLESGAKRVAIEIDDEASHNPRLVSQDKPAEAEQHGTSRLGRIPLGSTADAEAAGYRQGRAAHFSR